jgi:hypothetical protein
MALELAVKLASIANCPTRSYAAPKLGCQPSFIFLTYVTKSHIKLVYLLLSNTPALVLYLRASHERNCQLNRATWGAPRLG